MLHAFLVENTLAGKQLRKNLIKDKKFKYKIKFKLKVLRDRRRFPLPTLREANPLKHPGTNLHHKPTINKRRKAQILPSNSNTPKVSTQMT